MPKWLERLWDGVVIVFPILAVAAASSAAVTNALQADVLDMCIWAAVAVIWAWLAWRTWTK